MAHGAVGDGAANDGAAIQETIDAAQAGSGDVLIDRAYKLNRLLTYDMGKPLVMRFTGAGKLTWISDFGIPAPTGVTATAQAGSTSFGAQTNYYRVTAYNANGEGLASLEVSAAITAGQEVALDWNAVLGAIPGVAGYRVYRGTASWGENVYYDVGNVTSYTDTNAAPSGSAHAPLQGRIYAIGVTGTSSRDAPIAFEGAKLIGPGGDFAYAGNGVRGALMNGLQLAPRAVLGGPSEFYITGFNAGYAFHGEHQRVFNGAAQGNYIGEYFSPDPPGGGFGDQHIEGVALDTNMLASTAISPTSNPMVLVLHDRVHRGFGPFGIYIEGGNNGITGSAMESCTENHCHYEAIGNAGIYGEGGSPEVNSLALRTCGGYWATSKTASGYTSGYNIYGLSSLQELEIDGSSFFTAPFPGAAAGSSALISAGLIYRAKWLRGEGAVSTVRSAGISIVSALSVEDFIIEGEGTYQVMAVTDIFVKRGFPLAPNGLHGTGPQATSYTVSALAPIIGVAAQDVPSAAPSFNFIPVTIRGRCRFRNVQATTANQYLVADSGHDAAVATQSTPPTDSTPVLGVSLADAAPNSLTDGLLIPAPPIKARQAGTGLTLAGNSFNVNTGLDDNGQAGLLCIPPDMVVSSGITWIANLIRGVRVRPKRNIVVVSIAFNVQTAASANDSIDVAILSSTGNRLASAGATAGLVNSTGVKTIPISFTMLAGSVYYVVMGYGTLGGTAATMTNILTGGSGSAGSGQLFGAAYPVAEVTQATSGIPIGASIAYSVAGSAPLMALRES